MTSPQIHEAVQSVHTLLASRGLPYADAVIPTDRLHVSLEYLFLDNPQKVQQAAKVLRDSQDELRSYTASVPELQFNIEGVGTFHDAVLYANTRCSMFVLDFVKLVREKLKAGGVRVEERRDFHPHMTLLNLRKKLREKHDVESIDSTIVDRLCDTTFGTQSINSISLCKMEPDSTGFYTTVVDIDV